MSEVVTTYRATTMSPEHWAHIAPFVRAAVSDYGPPTPERARRLLTILARHVHWCWQTNAYPLERNVILRREVIADSVEQGMAAFSPRTRATYRSQLFALSDALLTSPHRPAFVPTLGAQPALAPYTEREVTLLRAWAAGQATNYRRVNATLILALGLGAGLSAREMSGLRCNHVTVDEDGVLLDVREGTRPRIVPVLAEWESPIAQFVRAAFGFDQWLLMPGRHARVYQKGTVSNFLDTTNDRPFGVNSNRLRTTWVVQHLTLGTPAKLLTRAAGFASPQALGRYIEFVPDVDVDLARRHLRALAKTEGTLWRNS